MQFKHNLFSMPQLNQKKAKVRGEFYFSTKCIVKTQREYQCRFGIKKAPAERLSLDSVENY